MAGLTRAAPLNPAVSGAREFPANSAWIQSDAAFMFSSAPAT